ncbi:hypothetical protein [Flavobacterium sp.]|uniref:hypothetical protein n=1 Tax=Flavobacterium sp. TaxID=239 RepID=UPI003753566B
MKKIFFIVIVIFTFSCKDKKSENKTEIKSKVVNKNQFEKLITEEEFIDSVNIGLKGKFRIDLKKYRSLDSVYVEIKFFEKQNTKWNLKQNLKFEKDGLTSCDIEIKDFNNDGLNDMTFQSSVAARGANEIRKLFIFDKPKGELKYIRNSENFPNIRYNKELNCLDAFIIYGGTQTAFMKISKDTLWEFASVELFDNRITIIDTDIYGKKTEIRNEKFEKDIYTRYKNYKPLIENEIEN